MGRCQPFRCNFRRFLAEQFRALFKNNSTEHFFLAFGRPIPWDREPTVPGADDDNPPLNIDSVKSEIEAWQQAVGFKLIDFNDVFHVVPRVDWEPNVVYDQYEDDADLFGPEDDEFKRFYVLVDGKDVYKCLGNNFGGPSTEKPTGVSTEAFIRPSDNYRWKFMYRVPEDLRDFLTEDYMPVQFIEAEGVIPDETLLQFNVQEAAIAGSIDYIELIYAGDNPPEFPQAAYPFVVPPASGHFVQRSEFSVVHGNDIQSFPSIGEVELEGSANSNDDAYNNMILRATPGTGGGGSGPVEQRVIIDYDGTTKYATLNAPFSGNVGVGDDYEVKSRELKGNLSAGLSEVNDIYNGYVATIVSGPGIGQQRKVIAYDGDGTTWGAGVFTLDAPWDVDLVADANPALSSFYQVTPEVVITGDGTDCTATAVVDNQGVIIGISVVTRGSGYTRADVEVTPVFPLGAPTPAEADAVISPPGGHGSNALKELCGRRVLIRVRLDQDELGEFAVANDFRQFWMVRNPVLNDTTDRLAATEEPRQILLEVFDSGGNLLSNSFVPGDFVFGAETGAVGEIAPAPDGWQVDPGSGGTIGYLTIQDYTTDAFRVPDPPSLPNGEFLHTFDPTFTTLTQNIATVEKVDQVPRQSPPAYKQTYDLTLQSDGTIANQFTDASFTLDRLARGPSELRLTDASGYVSGEDLTVGETVTGQQSLATAVVTSWTAAGTPGDPGSVLGITSVSGTFLDGEVVTGGSSTYSIVIDIGGQEDASAEGTIVEWVPAVDGLTGVLKLIDVRGDFEVGEQVSEYDPVADTTVTNIGEVTAISVPELVHRSGELLYIQNVKPIQRDIEQAEEFKILVEF